MKRDKAKTLMSLSHWCVNMLSLSYLYDADWGSCEGGLHEEMWREPNRLEFLLATISPAAKFIFYSMKRIVHHSL